MNLAQKTIAAGIVVLLWSAVFGTAVFIGLGLDTAPLARDAAATDPLSVLFVLAALALFTIGCGVLACGVVLQRHEAAALQLARVLAMFAVCYGVAAVAVTVVLMWVRTSAGTTILWTALAGIVVLAVWKAAVDAACSRFVRAARGSVRLPWPSAGSAATPPDAAGWDQ